MNFEAAKQKLSSLAELVRCALIEHVYFRFKHPKLAENIRHSSAAHEAGHALIAYLYDVQINRFLINKLLPGTENAIVSLVGDHIQPHIRNHINADDLQYRNGAKMLLSLAGIATEHRIEPNLFADRLQELHDNALTWSDVAFPREKARTNMRRLTGRPITPPLIGDTTTALLFELVELFEQPLFHKAIDTLTHLFLEKGKMEGDINAEIEQALLENHISKLDILKMKKELWRVEARMVDVTKNSADRKKKPRFKK